MVVEVVELVVVEDEVVVKLVVVEVDWVDESVVVVEVD